MSSVLCTFSGNKGDVLWSLPTARELSWTTGTKVDFCTMGVCGSLVPLLQHQSYIDKAFALDNWIATGDPHGLQPWYPPKEAENGYEKVFHLTYRAHPSGSGMTLIDFIANQQGLTLESDVLPFLEIEETGLERIPENTIAFGFNPYDQPNKDSFLMRLRGMVPECQFVDVTVFPWLEAARWIKRATGFVGCRSANYVMAHGVKQENIFVYETHPQRHRDGGLGFIFGCPYNPEETAPLNSNPEQAAIIAAGVIRNWQQTKKEKEVLQNA